MAQKTELFFITYKMLRGINPTQQDYAPCLCTVNWYAHILDYVYETDSKGKLHVHLLVRAKRNVFWKKFIIKNFSMKAIAVYDEDKLVNKYFKKQVANEWEQGQLLDSLYAHNYYLF